MRLVLDVGVGTLPWVLRSQGMRSRQAVEAYPDIAEDMQYVCVDRFDFAMIPDWQECRKTIRRNGRKIRGGVTLLVADGRRLPFSDATADVAILADIFSVPSADWCLCSIDCSCECTRCECSGAVEWTSSDTACCGRPYRGISAMDKYAMLAEAVRVLRPGGKLIVACYQTLWNADTAFAAVVEDSNLEPVAEYDGRWFDQYHWLTFGYLERFYRKT